MAMKQKKAVLPLEYEHYVFDLYGTLVDIHTDENQPQAWEKLALFYGYYGAYYEPEELHRRYRTLVGIMERELKQSLQEDPHYDHEAAPEIEITDVFLALFTEAGVEADRTLAVHAGQFFRALTTEYVCCYPGTAPMLSKLKQAGKKVYLLSNAQRIFTEFEIRKLDILKYFDDVLISSDYRVKKPDERFFQVLLERHPMEKEQTLFIGNDSRADIGGARNVGLHTYYVNSNISPAGDKAPEADYIVEHFTQWEME